MSPDSFLVILVTRPYLWVGLVSLRLWLYNRPGLKPPIASRYIKGLHGPGTLCHGGSDKTSGTEKRVRDSLKAAGFTVLPASVHLIAPLRDKHDNWRKFTPDILVIHKGRRIVVEVDPYRHHGDPTGPQATPGSWGMDKVFHDVERNYAYSATGWAVVRVRIGWPPENSWRRLGRFDVVLDESDFVPFDHADRVRRAVVSARRVDASAWNKQLAALAPWSG